MVGNFDNKSNANDENCAAVTLKLKNPAISEASIVLASAIENCMISLEDKVTLDLVSKTSDNNLINTVKLDD